MNEVEQMERVNLLQAEEVRELVRKRKQYEYKLQKRSKVKEDFLEYITYESNLLKLLEMRRESTGYQHKQAEIEGSIKTRINKLFKILEHRNQSDAKIWLSHIQFLKTSGWDEAVSRLYLRMLQVHSDKPGLWIEAARWEFEDLGSAENGRKVMLRGLRFLPKSWILQREYVKLELLYVEQLRKRKDVLAGSNNTEDDTDDKDEQEDDNADDGVLDCSIVRLVAMNAVETIEDPSFIVSLIATIRIFPFAEKVAQELLDTLEEKYPESVITWDTIAREKLKDGIIPCVEKYFQGLESMKSKELFGLAFSTLTELPTIFPKCMVRITKNIMKLLKFGKENSLLSVEHFKFWIELLDDESHADEKSEIIDLAVETHPHSVDLWTEKMVFASKLPEEATKSDAMKATKAAQKHFSDALEALKNEKDSSLKIWNVMLRLVDPETGWAMLTDEDSLLDRNNPALRLLHLGRAGYKSLTCAREVYSSYKLLPPFSAEFHWKMLSLEAEQDQVDTGHSRQVLSILCDQFGKEDPRCWLEAARLEIDSGKPLEAATILARAEANLKPELRGKFAILRDKMNL